jgi:hypothetical protein
MHFHKSSEAKCVLKSFQLILHITREIMLSILFTRGKNWRLLDPENSSQNLRGGPQCMDNKVVAFFFPAAFWHLNLAAAAGSWTGEPFVVVVVVAVISALLSSKNSL